MHPRLAQWALGFVVLVISSYLIHRGPDYFELILACIAGCGAIVLCTIGLLSNSSAKARVASSTKNASASTIFTTVVWTLFWYATGMALTLAVRRVGGAVLSCDDLNNQYFHAHACSLWRTLEACAWSSFVLGVASSFVAVYDMYLQEVVEGREYPTLCTPTPTMACANVLQMACDVSLHWAQLVWHPCSMAQRNICP
jgi:hypothetical protein